MSIPNFEALVPLTAQLRSDSLKQQLVAISTLNDAGEAGIPMLIDFLRSAQENSPRVADGKVYQLLYGHPSPTVQTFLSATFPRGLVPPTVDQTVDYQALQTLLVQQAYEAADRLTFQLLCELAGPAAMARKWVYFTEVDSIPAADLKTLDLLWRIYSEDKFGFSKQRQIWLSLNQNWDLLWEKLAWKSANVWTRYPGEFIWDLSAPIGHLPLSNQLRGVRMMASLLCHPVWQEGAR